MNQPAMREVEVFDESGFSAGFIILLPDDVEEPTPMAGVDRAIAAHRAAVAADEANFTDDFKPICEEAAAASMKVEVAAFQAFVAAPCRCWEDVQAKVGYLLTGTVGQRTPLLDCLSYEEYEVAGTDLAETFLRSLVVAP